MKSHDIRTGFLDFFRRHDHQVVASAPLVPQGDPTLLFVNAGMVPFKNAFLGREEPPAPRVASSQKCLRVSGKHNDLENVGPSPRHHTFFEMLGNFSFGAYFKEEAIRAAWELVTEVWEMPPEHLFATVYEDDDEAEELWRALSTLPAGRVLRCGAADNFWSMGDTGPCGPSSEIHIDLTPDRPEVGWEEGTESGRYVELWNLVFMQFDRGPDGTTEPLPNPSIDTGAGLERVAMILQGGATNYDTDLFQPLIRAAAELASAPYGEVEDRDVSLRVVADHLRAVTFLLADGVIPGNEGRGYVLRRILRRALRHGLRLGLEEPFLHRLVPVVGEVLGAAYPELAATRDASVATVEAEEEKFLSTLAAGSRELQAAIEEAREEGLEVLPGGAAFRLYDTHGLPLEVIREIAEEERMGFDQEGFERQMAERRAQSRAATGEGQKRQAELLRALHGQAQDEEENAETPFEGYDRLVAHGVEVRRLAASTADGAVAATALEVGQEGVAVLERTVFYAESGGQVGDTGTLTWDEEGGGEGAGRARVVDTRKDAAGTVLHHLRVEAGTLRRGAAVELEVDAEERRAAQRNHTATHLLHAALREELGEGVRQAGSRVDPERLRFDFTFPRPVEAEELRRVEDRIQRWVLRAVDLRVRTMAHRDAVAAGAMALFGEKYGDVVRTVEIPGFSLELCGGCHVDNTGEIGLVLLTGERGVASGVRRIEAVSGRGAIERVRRRDALLEEAAAAAGSEPERLVGEVERLRGQLVERERELEALRLEMLEGGGGGGGPEAVDVDGVAVLAREVPPAPSGELRNMADTLRSKLGSGVVVIGTRDGDKVTLIAAVSQDLEGRVHAGRIVQRLAAVVGGGGGGRGDFAQAGGREPEKLPDALEAAVEAVREQLG